jgi:hypothetical protein
VRLKSNIVVLKNTKKTRVSTKKDLLPDVLALFEFRKFTKKLLVLHHPNCLGHTVPGNTYWGGGRGEGEGERGKGEVWVEGSVEESVEGRYSSLRARTLNLPFLDWHLEQASRITAIVSGIKNMPKNRINNYLFLREGMYHARVDRRWIGKTFKCNFFLKRFRKFFRGDSRTMLWAS